MIASPFRRREETAALGRALEMLDEGVVVIGLDGCLLQANTSGCAILDLDRELAYADPSWWRRVAARRARDGGELGVGAGVVRTGEGVRDVLVDFTSPDGTAMLLSVNCQPLRDLAGVIGGAVLSFRDVTESEAARRALVESQERLREAHRVAGLASWDWRPDTDEVVVHQALAGREGMHDRPLPRSVLVAEMAPEALALADADIAEMVAGERDASVRRHLEVRPEGSRWMETRMRAVREVDGTLRCVCGTSQDVTETELAKRAAAADRDFVQATLDSLGEHIAVLDRDGEIILTNRAWTAFGVANEGTSHGISGNYLAACDADVGDPIASRTAAGLRDILSGQESDFALLYPCHSPTEDRWFVVRAVRFDGDGDARVVVSHDDVTEAHRTEAEVATQAALLDEVAAAVIATDLLGNVTHWNRGAEELYGWSAEETVGHSARSFVVGPEAVARAAEIMETVHATGAWEGEFELQRKDGSHFPAFVRDALLRDRSGRFNGVVGVSVDMSDRVAAERTLRATRDYMRAVADCMGDGLFTLDTEGALIYMNNAAERILGTSFETLRGRPMEELVHPVAATAGEGCPFLAALRDGTTMRVEDGGFVRGDGSFLPVAYTAAPFETADGVKGCAVVFEDISERKAREASLRRDADTVRWIGRITEALDAERFELFAQPIVDLRSGETVQREMLIRLREPDGSIVGPGAFLPVAEQSGLIGEIDRWVVRRGTEIAATGVAVEINLSGRSMSDHGVLEHIEKCIRNVDADPSLLVFEITETAIVEDAAAARVFAERLHELGCKLALDDFGTGYGGFTYLKQIPVDYLKIDIEFVRDLTTDAASRHVVEAVVALARGFKLETVAEGVEDAETLDLLRELGVDFGQGYHIARPAPFTTEPTERSA